MKKLDKFIIGFLVGLLIVGGILVIFQPSPKIIPEQKMQECIKNNGQYRVSDHSLKDDGSDYRMTCEIPEHKLWEIKINNN